MRGQAVPSGLALRLAAYALIFTGVLLLLQDRQLYFPDTLPLENALAEARRDGLAPWPEAESYRGLLREPVPRDEPVRGTLVLFHGNAGHAGHRAYYAEMLASLGLRVILAEYPAYGPRPGKLGENALVSDALATLALARRQYPRPLLVAGESLGAGVAAATLAQAPDAGDALLLITPWDTLAHVAGHHYPWLPVSWLLRDRYDSVANLAAYRGRVAVVVAAQDGIVPARFGEALHASLAAPKRLWTIAQADHNDWAGYVDAAWWRALVAFLLGAGPAPDAAPAAAAATR
jgi:dienelactone hydrolase